MTLTVPGPQGNLAIATMASSDVAKKSIKLVCPSTRPRPLPRSATRTQVTFHIIYISVMLLLLGDGKRHRRGSVTIRGTVTAHSWETHDPPPSRIGEKKRCVGR
jgi:hypothetical protein